MIKHPGKVTSYVSSTGVEHYVDEGSVLYLPETDVDIASGVFYIKSPDKETMIFRPQAIHLTPDPEALEIEEEDEYPEVDR